MSSIRHLNYTYLGGGGKRIREGWAGDNGQEFLSIASVSVPIEQIKFHSDGGELIPFEKHRKYLFFKSILEGKSPKETEYYQSQTFDNEEEAEKFIDRKVELLRVASQGRDFFEISGGCWFDSRFFIEDGAHRTLALASIGKKTIRINICFQNW